ncbi:uncharacterized protein DEA37_0011011, partial [Paragonimus westermani]
PCLVTDDLHCNRHGHMSKELAKILSNLGYAVVMEPQVLKANSFMKPGVTAISDGAAMLLDITPTSKQRIILDFRGPILLEPSTGCVNDYLEIRDGQFGFSPMIGRFCTDNRMLRPITSTGQWLWLHFHTDFSIEKSGFQAVFYYDLIPADVTIESIITVSTGGVFSANNVSQLMQTQVQNVNKPGFQMINRLREIILDFRTSEPDKQTTQRLRKSIKRTFNAAELRVIARIQKLPLPSIKGDQPIGATSHCVYQFVCNCGESYIGRTERCLISRMKEHLPKWVQKSVLPENGNVSETHKQPVSSAARHILTTCHAIDPSCAFKILLRHSNPRFLRFADAVAINRLKPALCVQKQLFVNLTLPWT